MVPTGWASTRMHVRLRTGEDGGELRPLLGEQGWNNHFRRRFHSHDPAKPLLRSVGALTCLSAPTVINDPANTAHTCALTHIHSYRMNGVLPRRVLL